jgi:hypothetical protein
MDALGRALSEVIQCITAWLASRQPTSSAASGDAPRRAERSKSPRTNSPDHRIETSALGV